MKKMIAILAVVALTASCFAGNITITATTAAGKQATIAYTATGGVPVGLSMQLNRTAGTGNLTAAATATASHRVFIDYAYTNGTAGMDPTTGINPAAHPVALAAGPGAATLPVSTFPVALCMGTLGTAPASGTLAVLTFSAGGTYTLSADTANRGGIVDATGAAMTANFPVTFTIVDSGCATCKGDLTGDSRVRTNDLSALIGFMNVNGTNSDAALLPCGDMTGDGRIRTNDLSALIGAMNVYGTNIACPIPGY